ncbi:MAG: ISC system 2Fe-2S type ferredoxin [Candidatus Dasytiphilus stammeri]
MPTIIFLPHHILIPEPIKIDAVVGETILDAALRNGILIEHACERSCACATCHCIVRKGFSSLMSKNENEEDMLDKAWGLEATSRLSCQAKVTNKDLVVEIPRYSINILAE